jgi:ABC-type sugar transport system substrate-binding protein
MSLADLHDRLERSLTLHPPVADWVPAVMEAIRADAKQLGHSIIDLCPAGREQSLALTHLEEVVMWAIKGIALDQSGAPPKKSEFWS